MHVLVLLPAQIHSCPNAFLSPKLYFIPVQEQPAHTPFPAHTHIYALLTHHHHHTYTHTCKHTHVNTRARTHAPPASCRSSLSECGDWFNGLPIRQAPARTGVSTRYRPLTPDTHSHKDTHTRTHTLTQRHTYAHAHTHSHTNTYSHTHCLTHSLTHSLTLSQIDVGRPSRRPPRLRLIH